MCWLVMWYVGIGGVVSAITETGLVITLLVFSLGQALSSGADSFLNINLMVKVVFSHRTIILCLVTWVTFHCGRITKFCSTFII